MDSLIDEISSLLTSVDLEKKEFDEREKHIIEKAYKKVFGQDVNNSSCRDCFKDAVNKISTLTPQKIKLIMERKFKLKPDILLQTHGSPDVYTNANLNDEAAVAILKKHPVLINHFEEFPDNWEQLVNDYGASVPVAPDSAAPQQINEEEKANHIATYRKTIESKTVKQLQDIAQENNLPREDYAGLLKQDLLDYISGRLYEQAK